MLWLWIVIGVIVAASVASTIGYRMLAKRHEVPCPSWLWWVLDTPFRRRQASILISRLDLSEGMHVLDAGCGPGRLSIPVARAVGASGSVLAVDLQKAMLRRARQRAERAGLTNIRFLEAGLGEGKLPPQSFDRALLVTVLGEIVDKGRAFREIVSSLKPGGFLSVTEILPDPHYQTMRAVRDLGAHAGLRVARTFGSFLAYTMHLEKP